MAATEGRTVCYIPLLCGLRLWSGPATFKSQLAWRNSKGQAEATTLHWRPFLSVGDKEEAIQRWRPVSWEIDQKQNKDLICTICTNRSISPRSLACSTGHHGSGLLVPEHHSVCTDRLQRTSTVLHTQKTIDGAE